MERYDGRRCVGQRRVERGELSVRDAPAPGVFQSAVPARGGVEPDDVHRADLRPDRITSRRRRSGRRTPPATGPRGRRTSSDVVVPGQRDGRDVERCDEFVVAIEVPRFAVFRQVARDDHAVDVPVRHRRDGALEVPLGTVEHLPGPRLLRGDVGSGDDGDPCRLRCPRAVESRDGRLPSSTVGPTCLSSVGGRFRDISSRSGRRGR